MHKLESVQEHEVHKIRWDFKMQTNHWILNRRQDQVLINKKKKSCHHVDFAVPVGLSENER